MASDPPRRLLFLFVLVTLVPSLALVASGWRLLEQDRALSIAQVSERREQAADLVVSELERVIGAAEQGLRDPATLRPGVEGAGDAVIVTFEPDGLDVFPAEWLPFYPRTDAGREAPAPRFAAGEDLEFRRQDAAAAIRAYRALAGSTDPAVRVGALVRLARTLRKTGAPDEALIVYAGLMTQSGVSVGGVPADLLARWARCGILEALQRRDDLQNEARALDADLTRGRWRLDRATFALHREDAARWIGTAAGVGSDQDRLALASAVESLWIEWQGQSPEQRTRSGRRVMPSPDIPVTILWSSTSDRLSALVAAPSYVERQWLAKVTAPLDRQRLRLALSETTARDASGRETRRTLGETALPWTVAVTDVDPEGDLARMAGRRALWVWGLVLLLATTIGGIVIIARVVLRDQAVARLQSDFVSSVSHEFRTPLTSLRQLTEVLLDGRVAAEDRRDTYYRALARQTDRLQRLVESLLDFGRMEAGTSPYRMEPLDACALVGSVVTEFEQDRAASGYHVELRVDGLQGLTATVAGDREALTHAVWNLLDNAVKYSPDCRTVWVDVERSGSRLAIHVRDRGLGVPRGEHAEIFRKFVRGADAKAHGISGTGIGLAMVQHIVSSHGGKVTVASEPGAGSTFTLVLPMVDTCPAS